jgi:hypothetical protein
VITERARDHFDNTEVSSGPVRRFRHSPVGSASCFWSTTARAETHRPIGDGERLSQRQAAGNFHEVSAYLPYFRHGLAGRAYDLRGTENATSNGIKSMACCRALTFAVRLTVVALQVVGVSAVWAGGLEL